MKENKLLLALGLLIGFISNWNIILMDKSVNSYIFGNGLMLFGYVIMYYVGLKQNTGD